MEIYGMEKLSMVDCDGKLSSVVFTGGCNMRCPFCHNSEIVLGVKNLESMDIYDVLAHLKKRRGLIDAVVISGGEPTLQKGLDEFICSVKTLGYFVKLDTNGLRPDAIERLLDMKLIDYIAMDVKNCRDKYSMTAGVDVDTSKIDASIALIKERCPDYEFRTTVISEFHTREDIASLTQWISGAKRYFMQKYKDDDNCISHGYHEVSHDDILLYKRTAEENIPFVGLRGY